MLRLAAAALCLVWGPACGRPVSPAVRQAEELTRELDQLAARMVAIDGRIRVWRELADRHRSVSAVVCRSHELHVEAMREARERTLRAKRAATAARPAMHEPLLEE